MPIRDNLFLPMKFAFWSSTLMNGTLWIFQPSGSIVIISLFSGFIVSPLSHAGFLAVSSCRMHLKSPDLSFCCMRRAVFSFGLPESAITNNCSVFVFNLKM